MDTYIEKIKLVTPKKWVKENPRCKRKIKTLMKKYSTAYYEGNALISDLDFEVLVDTLKLINPKDKYLTTPGWGYKIRKGVKHIYGKVGTLPYYYDYDNLTNLFEENEELIITPKLDGINFVTYFKKGKFYKCATRGNGQVGKNISWAYNDQLILPKELSQSTFAINGEVIYLGNTQTETHFRDKVASYLQSKDLINEKIKFIPFGLINTNYSQDYLMQILEINKISQVNLPFKIYNGLPKKETLTKLFKEYKKEFEVDGLVITNRNKSKQVAYKFKEE